MSIRYAIHRTAPSSSVVGKHRNGDRFRFNIRTCLLVAVTWLLSACGNPVDAPDQPVHISGRTMGTTFRITLSQCPSHMTPEQIEHRVHEILNGIDQRMSTYRDDSQITIFNRAEHTDWCEVSHDTAAVIAHAQQVSRSTDGMFDITVAPLIELWAFDKAQALADTPTNEQIAGVLQHVGFEKIEVRQSPPRIRKTMPNVRIDLSAIAKGYAVDRVAEYLNTLSTPGFLVEVGGEIRVAGANAQGRPWTIGLEEPAIDKRSIHRTVQLHAGAVATSGTYRNFHAIDGKRYPHLINPKTGRPIVHRTVSVTVIADTCMHADAMATALITLGAEKGRPLAERLNLAALFIKKNETGELSEVTTPAFERRVGSADAGDGHLSPTR